jgi:hypothetical protein
MDEEDYYFTGARVAYQAPYHRQWCPRFYMYAERGNPESLLQAPPPETPSGYSMSTWAWGVALSIPPADLNPMARIRELVAALQKAAPPNPALDNDTTAPTIYMTYMPQVPGQARKLFNYEETRLRWAQQHSHPGIDVYTRPDEDGKPTAYTRKVQAVRADATWQVTLYFDPMAYIAEEWRAGFSQYPLTVFTDTGEHTVRFQDLHDACPLIGVLVDPGFEGCLDCAHNDLFCRTKFLREYLDDIDPGLLENTLWMRARGADSGAVSLGCQTPLIVEKDDLTKLLRRVKCPGFTMASNAVASGGAPNPQVKQLRMGWSTVRGQTMEKQKSAKRGAETRKAHDTTCGKGDDACVLRNEGCTAWRGWRKCTHRRQTTGELDEEALARFTKLSSVPLLDLQRGALLASVDFQYATDTGRLRDGEYCGTLRGRKSPGTGAYRVLLGPSRKQELHYFKDWEAQKRWLRRHAPWELERIEAVETMAPKVEISPLMRAVFYAMQDITSIRVGGGFGGSSHAIQMYRFRLTQHADPERYKVAYEVVAQGNGYSLCAQDMFGFWEVKYGGFTGPGGILPA